VASVHAARPGRWLRRRRHSTEGADAHIDGLAKKYLGVDEYPYRQPGEQRIKFVVAPDRIRYVNPR